MYGWRARIGLIVPAENTAMEPEFNRMAPDGVTIHTSRVRLPGDPPYRPEDRLRMDLNEKAAMEVAFADVDIIVYGCTARSFVKPGLDREIIDRIENATGIVATTTSTAIINATRKLHLRKLAVVTPYTEETNKNLTDFLKRNGLEIIRLVGRYMSDQELSSLSPCFPYRFAKKAHGPDIDGVLIACTNFMTIDVIPRLEKDLGKPVVSANTASMWDALMKLGVRDKVEGYGRLLAENS
jgi:maleate cis-trans isomerase